MEERKPADRHEAEQRPSLRASAGRLEEDEEVLSRMRRTIRKLEKRVFMLLLSVLMRTELPHRNRKMGGNHENWGDLYDVESKD